MGAKSKEHSHKYEKIDMGRRNPWPVFKCLLPACRHFIPIKMAIGYMNKCWNCHKTFAIGKRNLAQVHPTCNECAGKPELDVVTPVVEAPKPAAVPKVPEAEEANDAIDDVLAKVKF